MITRHNYIYCVLGVLGTAAFASATEAAEIVIKPTGNLTWLITKGGSGESNGEVGLDVGTKKGDTILFDFGDEAHHGLVTIDKKGTDNPSLKPGLVWSCAQTASPRGAVLRETECNGSSSKFGHSTTGILKLQVLDDFADDVHFWCTAHTDAMWGTIHLKP